ncbi:MAG: aminocarboxymuconate-semialdehyde decarboxylase, partial [Firmicutes bacterium]|nr:aminocarboxymuconate-semialdehyde decarboxylase [Bacillota bacterium]
PRALWDLEVQREQMARLGLDVRVVCPPPFAFRYGQEPPSFHARLNDSLAEGVASRNGAFIGLASVPLAEPELAARELERAVSDLGFPGVTIGSLVADFTLDDPRLEPFWATAEATRAVILLHPSEIPGADRMRSYHLRNLVGNPSGTALAAAQLIFGGVLDRHPQLKIILSHGGGALPWIIGRLDHGYAVRPECGGACARRPSSYLSSFYFDTIVFSDDVRSRLCEIVGPGRLLYGTDAPFDMSDTAGLATADHGTAMSLFKLEG